MSAVYASWGGIPVALGVDGQPAKVVYRRARGVDPSVSEVTFPRSMFSESLSPLLDANRFNPPEESTGTPLDALELFETAGIPIEPVARPPYMGDLILAQSAGGVQKTARARALYFDQVLVLNPRMDPPSVLVTLSDIRRWWEGFGAPITRSWNLRRRQGRVPDERRYLSHTAKGGGREPYTLREIVQVLLDALPGRLQIIRWPTLVWLDGSSSETGEGDGAPEVRCWGASPKEALRGLLDAFRLSLDIGPDLKARIYGPNEGTIGVLLDGDPENLSSWDPESGAGPWAERITADGNRHARRPTGAPARVLIVGDRTVHDVTQDFCTPVLCYPLQRPGEPPENVVVPVTPENLAAIARGIRQPELMSEEDPDAAGFLPDPLDRVAVNAIMGAVAPDVASVVQSGPTAPLPVPPVTFTVADKNDPTRAVRFTRATPADQFADLKARADPFAWQRLPLLDDDKYEEAYSWLPLGVRKLLREQLWRYYQVPILRLAPLLKRAERTVSGDRLEILVEAFSFREVSFRRLVPVDEALTKAQDADRARRVELHRFLIDRIAQARADRDRLARPSPVAVYDALARIVNTTAPASNGGISEQIRVWPFSFAPPPPPDGSIIQDGITLARAGSALMEKVKGSWLRFFVPGAVAALKGVDAETTVDQKLAELDAAIARDTAAARELSGKLDPVKALMDDLVSLEAAISAERKSTGEESPKLVEERRKLQESIRKAREEEKQRDIAERTPRYESRVRQENLTREPVAFRVIDAERGIICIDGPLPCWLADLSVQNQSSTYMIPMPVAVTHGSWNQRDVDGLGEANASESETQATADARRGALVVPVSDAPQANPYMVATGQALAALTPEQIALVGPLGHVVPKVESEPVAGSGQFAIEFMRDGFARDPSPLPGALLVTMDDSPPFRELVRLDGSSNYAELAARARPIALAALDAPDSTDAGSVTLVLPESVGCNGRISAVEVRLVSAGDGFVTEVSFDGDAAPLPGIVGRDREGGPVRLVFGLDPDATRDM